MQYNILDIPWLLLSSFAFFPFAFSLGSFRGQNIQSFTVDSSYFCGAGVLPTVCFLFLGMGMFIGAGACAGICCQNNSHSLNIYQ